MSKALDITIRDVLYEARRNNKNIDKNKIFKAYTFAAEKHKNQKRKSGESYIIHPLHVAYILASWGLDTQTICAALLHDVVEDTDATYEDIEKNFDEEVASLVEGVTKLSNLFKTVEEKKTKNYKKMFIAMEKDIRVIILKLADRLHNVRTLKYLRRDRQIAIAEETLELYAPIANKLGMNDLKKDLEDGAFKYLYPRWYRIIREELKEKIKENRNKLEETKKEIETELRRQRVWSIVRIETKNLYGIFNKAREKNIKNIEEIKDLFSIKIVTRSKSDCYRVLGIINTIYSLIPGSFKDYIAIPKNNMYQAIHEILIGKSGVMFETRICTYIMNNVARYGITSYFSYVMNNLNKKRNLDFKENLSGIRDSLELDNPKEFLETLKQELLGDEIYVFTPKGDIKVLPKDSNVIDFAYLIHGKLGNYINSCKINNKEMPLITKLKNGDIVEIIVDKEKINVQEEWLEEVKTAKAKKEILKLLKKNKQYPKQEKEIEIIANDRENLALEITNVFKENKINIESLEASVNGKKAKIKIVIEIKAKDNIKNILNEILEIKDVIGVKIDL